MNFFTKVKSFVSENVESVKKTVSKELNTIFAEND